MEVTVTKDYRSAYPEPPKAKAGDMLRPTPKDSEWPGWIWCTSEDGNSGWLPESYVDISDNNCTMRRDYDATELTISAGDRLTVMEEESGWLFCRDENGNRGWVPKENTRKLP